MPKVQSTVTVERPVEAVYRHFLELDKHPTDPDVESAAELAARGLFGAVGPRLRARLGDVCVLPADGRMAWLRSAPGVERRSAPAATRARAA